MKKKSLIFAALIMGIAAVAGASTVSAHGLFGCQGNMEPEEIAQVQQSRFESQAELLGISIDNLKNYWAEGKNMSQIAEELGISQEDLTVKMQANRQEQLQQRLQSLVDQGIITQEQSNKRLEFMNNNQQRGRKSGPFGQADANHKGMSWANQ